MISNIPTQLPLDKIAAEVAKIDDFWQDGSGAYMAIRPCHGVPDWLSKCEWIMRALAEISLLREQDILHVMINKLPPDTVVPLHTDTLAPTCHQPKAPRVERWHLPVVTNADCFFWDDNAGYTRMHLGSWWGPVPYWREHSVENTGKTERVHIVVDLDTHEPVEP
jgi:hypothetical protein